MQSGMVWSVWLVNQGLADILLPIQLVRCSSRFVNTCNSAQPSQCTICPIVLLTALKYFKHIWNFWYTVGVTWASEVVRFQCHDSLYLNWCRAKPNVQSHKLVICTVPQCCTMLHNVADSLRLGSDSQLILPWVKGTVNPLSQSLYPLQVDYVYFFLWLNNMIRLWFTLCYALLRFATLCYALLRFATLCYALLRFAYYLWSPESASRSLSKRDERLRPLHQALEDVVKGLRHHGTLFLANYLKCKFQNVSECFRTLWELLQMPNCLETSWNNTWQSNDSILFEWTLWKVFGSCLPSSAQFLQALKHVVAMQDTSWEAWNQHNAGAATLTPVLPSASRCFFYGTLSSCLGTAERSFQSEFQDPKMEVLYHIRLYFMGIFHYIGLT